MSVNYIDKSTGDLIRVAGQGKAEYGASTERKGDIVIPATTAGNFQTVSVVFAQAMPDNDYAVVIDEGTDTWAHCSVNVTNKTTTGFTLFFVNITAADAPQMTFKYRAFKLYTDTEYNEVLDDVAALKTVSTMTVTKQGNYINGTNFHGKKVGKVATIEINGDTGASIPWEQITTVGTAIGSATPLTELKCTSDMVNVTTGYDPNGNAITKWISPYCRAWIGNEGNIQVFLANPGAPDTSYTGNLFIGGAYITQ